MSTIETPPTKTGFAGASVSLRVLAGAVILLFFYYAAGVVITLLLSILLAYFLDPAVELLERARVPRTLGAMVMVLLLVAVLAGAGYSLVARTSDFAANWPKYGGVLRQAVGNVMRKINRFEGQVSQIAPDQSPTPAEQAAGSAPGKNKATTQGAGGSVASETPTGPVAAAARPDSSILHTFILRGIGSLYALILEATFVPFLVFFMLAEKRQVWHGTLQLFPASRRTAVKETLEDLRNVLRSYLAGMCIVTLIVIAISSAFFWFMGLDYPILTGIVSGLLNMVPYIGAVLAWLPAFLIALVKWRTLGSFVLIAGVLMSIHMLALNLIAPQLVGRRVRLNAVAITISLLFWGWVWGGMGLILAIPITATLRVICDHTESWKPVGRWLSA